MRKPGCLILLIIGVVLALLGLLIGALASPFLGERVPSLIKVSQPEIELPPEAISHVGALPVTNTLIASVLTSIVLFSLFFFAARKMSLIPKGLQNVMEFAVESLLNFAESVAGKENGRRFLPLVATIFLFVITNAWLSLLPIFGPIGIWEHGKFVPLLRGANTDMNVPATLAVMSFIFVEFWGITSIGFFKYGSKFIRLSFFLPRNFKSLKSLLGNVGLGIIDFFVGVIELVSEFIRLVSFTFRLFGNMTAGEILLLIATFLIPWVFAVPFYGLELLIGAIQALVFGGLTLVFATLAVMSHGEGEH